MAARVAGYRAEGYQRFQLKVGGDPAVDIERIHAVAAQLQAGDRLIADANTGWLMHDALHASSRRCAMSMSTSKQPCHSYEECLTIRQHCDHPFVLDEVIDSLGMLLRGHADRAMDVVNLKISKFGGLTALKQARDQCVTACGICHDDRRQLQGGDIVTAAITHLAHSTPPELLFTATDFNSYRHDEHRGGAPQRV